jgi:hypothetical protein
VPRAGVALLCLLVWPLAAGAGVKENKAREQREIARNMEAAYPQLQAAARSLEDFVAAGSEPRELPRYLDVARQGLAAYPHVSRFLDNHHGRAEAVGLAHLDTLISALRLSDAANRAGISTDLIDRTRIGLLMLYGTLPTRPAEMVPNPTYFEGRLVDELRPRSDAEIHYLNPFYNRALAADPTFAATFVPGSMEEALVAYMKALDATYAESRLASRLAALPRITLHLSAEAIAANLFKVRMLQSASGTR